MKAKTWCILVLIASVVAQSVGAQQTIGVAVASTTLNGKTTYHYQVFNTSAHRVVSVSIGRDVEHDASELTTYPEGWSFETGIAAGSVLSPAQWEVRVITTEESNAIDVEWHSINDSAHIPPEHTLSGFAVTVPCQSAQYLTAHWIVIFDNATTAVGKLTQLGRVVK